MHFDTLLMEITVTDAPEVFVLTNQKAAGLLKSIVV